MDHSNGTSLLDALVPDMADCEDLKDWVADHPEAFIARGSMDGLQMTLRSLNALSSLCEEWEWNAEFDDSTFIGSVHRRSGSDMYVLEAVVAGMDTGQVASEILARLRAPDVQERWSWSCLGISADCTFALEEATGGIVPGARVLLGFDAPEQARGPKIRFEPGIEGIAPIEFTFSEKGILALDKRLPEPLKRSKGSRS